jgi:SAM-dependent methyltransferase
VQDLYRDWLDLYDLQHDALSDDAGFFVALAGYLDLRPDHTILELACGTGRLLAPLLEAGYRVAGVDLQEAALERARRRLAPWGDRARLVRADMRDYALDQRFPLAFIGLNSFLHLLSAGDQLACLRCTRRHLRAAGLLAIDVQNPLTFLGGNAVPDVPRHRFTARDPHTGETVMQFGIERVDEAAQTVAVTLFVDRIAADGTLTRRLTCLTLRFVLRFELEALLRAASFTPEKCYGTYDLDPYTAESPRLIVLARAAGEGYRNGEG